MNFNENRRMNEKLQIKGRTSKIARISVVKCPIAPNLVLNAKSRHVYQMIQYINIKFYLS